MKLVDLTIREFLNSVASKEPAPGGGSVAALMCANGAALIAMVARLTVGKKAYAEYNQLMQEIITKADELKDKFINLIDKDTEAYNGVAQVFAMPKGDERKAAMQEALKVAALVPLEVMELGFETLKLAIEATDKSNKNATSDLKVAILNIESGILAADYNVQINLESITDEEFNKTISEKANDIIDQTITISHE